MSKMIKLSKSDWLRIGREQGYTRQASVGDAVAKFTEQMMRSPMASLKISLEIFKRELDKIDVSRNRDIDRVLSSAERDRVEALKNHLLEMAGLIRELAFLAIDPS